MKISIAKLGAMAVFLTAGLPLSAGLLATSTMTWTQLDATNYHYDLILNDTGTTTVGTFWFAWIPGQNYMPTTPFNIAGPTSWTPVITGGGAGNGHAVRWVAAVGVRLNPGDSQSGFGFDSATTPTEMAGNAVYFANPPVTTTVVYSAGAFSDAGLTFTIPLTAAATPEPSAIVLSSLGLAGLMAARRKRSNDI
jgi:hypothetical protein